MTAEQALQLAAEHHGFDAQPEGRCEGGESPTGAHLARLGDGRLVVYKWATDPQAYPRFERLFRRLEELRQVGYPLPTGYRALPVPGAVLLFQDAVPGSASDRVTDEFTESLLHLNELQRGMGRDLAGEAWTDFLVRTLSEGADGWCKHEPLEEHSPETRRIVLFAREVADRLRDQELPSGDLTHVDFHHRNVLQDAAGRPTAVIDWEGATSGDRVFDLVTYAYCLPVAEVSQWATSKVWETIERLGTPLSIAAYVAHMAVRIVDWSLRFHPELADMWIRHASARLARVAL